MLSMTRNRAVLLYWLARSHGPDEPFRIVEEASGNKLDMLLPLFEAADRDGDRESVLATLGESNANAFKL